MLRACTRQRILTMSEAKNRAILNALPDLMFIQTIDGVYVDYHCKDARDLLLRPTASSART